MTRIWKAGPAPVPFEGGCVCWCCCQYRDDGVSLDALAEDHGISPTVIKRILYDHGTELRKPGRPRVAKVKDSGPLLLCLALALLLPVVASAFGHGGRGWVAKVETSPWSIPSSMIRDGFSIDASAVEGATTTNTIRLDLPLEGPARLRYRAVLRKVRQHGSQDYHWRVTFEPVEGRP